MLHENQGMFIQTESFIPKYKHTGGKFYSKYTGRNLNGNNVKSKKNGSIQVWDNRNRFGKDGVRMWGETADMEQRAAYTEDTAS